MVLSTYSRHHYSHRVMKNTDQIINLEAIVPETLAGQRLDRVLAELFPQFSRAKLQDWIKKGQITVNKQLKRPKDKLMGGEAIQLTATLENKTHWQAQDIALEIIYEDPEILIINKPVGLVVHPAAGNPDSTLVNALLHHYPPLTQLPRAGIVHRLDKNTSGLLVVAKTLTAHTNLVKQLQKRKIEREYLAIVHGVLISGGTVNAPMGRHARKRTHMAIVENGKEAITHYRVLERFRAHTLLKVKLETGRTHQIRVHMAHINHAIVGDATYGRRLIPKGASSALLEILHDFKRQALHAHRLALTHPTTKEWLEWSVPMPSDMQNLVAALQQDLKP